MNITSRKSDFFFILGWNLTLIGYIYNPPLIREILFLFHFREYLSSIFRNLAKKNNYGGILVIK